MFLLVYNWTTRLVQLQVLCTVKFVIPFKLCVIHIYVCVHVHCIAFVFLVASGDGEKIMQFCPSFQIVQLMREGNEPQKACEMAVKMMADRSQEWFEVAVIALNTKVLESAWSCIICTCDASNTPSDFIFRAKLELQPPYGNGLISETRKSTVVFHLHSGRLEQYQ